MLYFVTHPEVVIDPVVPVPEWPLSDLGRDRMTRLLQQPWVDNLSAIYSSIERKAIDGAEILAEHVGLSPIHREELGENDRSSTGYLPEEEFQRTADVFFGSPDESVRGWETARAAQTRIVNAVQAVTREHTDDATIAIVSHGGVGALLLCHLSNLPISREHEQPGNGGGHYLVIDGETMSLVQGWTPIDA